MKSFLVPILGAALFAAPVSSFAQPAQPAPASQAADVAYADGEVRKVDKSAGKITLKHGEIKSLDMPPMTMVFGVADRALLDKVKQGDKVRFRAASQEGKFMITEIQGAGQ